MKSIRLQATLSLVLVLTLLADKTFCENFCDYLDQRQSRRPRIYVEPNPRLLIKAVDNDSSVTFTCEAGWLRTGYGNMKPRFCDFADTTSINLTSQEALSVQFALTLEWEIDQMGPFNATSLNPSLIERGIVISTTCDFDSQQIYDLLVSGESSCRDRIRSMSNLSANCTSTLNVTRVAANSNVQLQCSVRPVLCREEDIRERSSRVQLMLQDLLDPPPGLRVDKLNSSTLYLSWNRPSTLSGIPISYYSVDINNLVTTSTVNITTADQPSINQNMTSLDISMLGSIGYLHDPGCESLQFSVSAWNSVGKGANNTVLYSQESLQRTHVYTALHSPDVLCVLCSFLSTSEAQGCQAMLQKETQNNHNFTTLMFINLTVSREGSVIEAFDCFSGLSAGNYTIKVQEIECTGGLGLRQFLHNHVSVTGMKDISEESNLIATSDALIMTQGTAMVASTAQTIGFSVATAILIVICVLLLALLLILTIMVKRNNRELPPKGIQIPPASLVIQHTSPHSKTDKQLNHDSNQDQESDLLYDNDFNVGPINSNQPVPPTEYGYTTVVHSRQIRPKRPDTEMNIEMDSCVAYGKTA